MESEVLSEHGETDVGGEALADPEEEPLGARRGRRRQGRGDLRVPAPPCGGRRVGDPFRPDADALTSPLRRWRRTTLSRWTKRRRHRIASTTTTPDRETSFDLYKFRGGWRRTERLLGRAGYGR
ncbi:hypothetical protein BAE44_0020633 [Dichanthelium oligosanthes]|uniref:Uncharacterized protein n=1 Tax=Dichanthelium oligosanthes TaxID=888268 RepID=A0A1E5UZT7_9POAL|nr:hypothetical protein BAE44_0020633 [Dichanthelium oligosanthes]